MILTQLRASLLGVFGLTMLELDVVIGGSSSPPGISTLAHSFAIEYRLRLIQINLGDAAPTSPIVELSLLMMQVVIGKFDRICGFVHWLLRRAEIINVRQILVISFLIV